MRNIFLLLALLLALTVGRWRASAQPGTAAGTLAAPAANPTAPAVSRSPAPAAPAAPASAAPAPASQSRALPGLIASPSVPAVGPVPGQPNVVLVLLDGVRQQEWTGKALDDYGNPVRTAELLPNLTRLRKSGLFFPHFQISNPAGVSLPAYADIFAGRRQERITSNYPPADDFRSHYPTLLQVIKRDLGLPFDGVALHSSWSKLCPIAAMPPLDPSEDFYRSCAFANNANPSPGYFKPEIYGGSRSDIDTFLELAQELPRRHPRRSPRRPSRSPSPRLRPSPRAPGQHRSGKPRGRRARPGSARAAGHGPQQHGFS